MFLFYFIGLHPFCQIIIKTSATLSVMVREGALSGVCRDFLNQLAQAFNVLTVGASLRW